MSHIDLNGILDIGDLDFGMIEIHQNGHVYVRCNMYGSGAMECVKLIYNMLVSR